MGSFSDQVRDFTRQYEERMQDFHLVRAIETQRSVQEGSEITGAPGQPVDENNLRPSWILEHLAALRSQTSTGVEYARPIEDGVGPHGPLTLRSQVGGFHSVALTIAGNQKIVDHAMRETKRAKPIVLHSTLSPRRRP